MVENKQTKKRIARKLVILFGQAVTRGREGGGVAKRDGIKCTLSDVAQQANK